MRITTLIVLIGIIALIFAGQTVYNADLEINQTRDIYNFTDTSLSWNDSIGEIVKSQGDSNLNIREYEVNVQRLWGVLGSFVNFIGYSTTEIFKWGIEYGYNHPEHDLGFFLNFLIKLFWIMLIIALIPLVVPVLALVYLSGKGTYFIIIKTKDWLKNGKKEK